ncbi:phospholipase D family protein [Solirubrobacter soli]|uniref:phospholipase D family protein n=1 Tax=Solirubrobacter soli TaxID=363832 RepID=UPI0007E8E25A|nr:phospholipase D family protein [Solirubrobacter soli]
MRLIHSGWLTEIRDGIQADGSRLRIVAPFIKDAALEALLRRRRPAAIDVITRFNLADFASGVSDTAALRRILLAGGRVRGVQGLHAKLYVCGSARAIVTSANLTIAAMHQNQEFGCVSDQRQFVTAANRYFDDLWRQAKPDLTLKRLKEWDDLLEPIIAQGSRPKLTAGLRDYGAASPMAQVAPPVSARSGSGSGFVKFFGEGDNRVSRDVETIEEVRRSGCHWACTYPHNRRPKSVNDGDTVYLGRLVSGPNDLLVFGRATALAYMPGRDDATRADIRRRPWKAQWPHYARVHGAEFIAGPLSNGVPLSELMDELGSRAFASTNENALSGTGNTNPRKAIRQHPAVRLTPAGLAWLSQQFDEAIDQVGRVPDAALDQLDWPRVPNR